QLDDGEFPPLRSVDQTNLPVQPTPFVGRERELAEVLALLDAHRIVTLTGPGGSGKTRLALQAAAESVEQYGDGVWFVSLAAVRDPDLIEPTIARVVGGPDDLFEFLAGKRTLLVLDNLEQLLPDAAEIVVRLDARILATSRSRLNVATEQEFPVPTLPFDDAAALFTQRARQLEPHFEPRAAGRHIAERPEGLPPALEALQSPADNTRLRRGEDGRFFMLGTIKELALEKLRDLSDESSLGRRHDDYFLAVAEALDARDRLSGMRDLSAESLDRFERELASYRATRAGLSEGWRPDGRA